MKMTQQLLIGLTFLLLAAFPGTDLKATHFMGVDITYTCLPGAGNCVYRIFHSTYYDCAGAATAVPPNNPPAPTLNFTPTTCSTPTLVGGWVLVSYLEVTPICPSASTRCTSTTSAINGVREGRYYADYNFCSVNCTVYNVTWGNCCRNGTISSGAANAGIYTGNTQINLGLTPCNSSPQFSVIPVPYLCAGQAFTFNQGAYDPDCDSLSYALSTCQANSSTQVNYITGYSPQQPLGPTWNVSMNPLNGDITITPTPAPPAPGGGAPVTGVLCVTVSEFRNGVKIGEVSRDIQVTVVNCASNTSPTLTPVTNLSPSATQTGPFAIQACTFDPFTFDIGGQDADSAQNLILSWDPVIAPSGATFTQVGNPSVANSIPGVSGTPLNGRVTWTPTAPGIYAIVFSITDDACPFLGNSQVAVIIKVVSCRLNPVITTNRIGCYDVEFTLCPNGGTGPYTFSFTSGDGTGPVTLTSTTGCVTYTHSYPAIDNPTNYNYSANFSDDGGLVASAQGSIVLQNDAIADAGPDQSTCPNQVIQIGTVPLPGYTYCWRGILTNLGLPNGADRKVARPFVSLNNTTSGPITICYEVTATSPLGCERKDTTCVTYNPKPKPTFTVNGPVCQDEIATVTFTGVQHAGTTYDWNFGTGKDASGNSNASGVGPHLVTWSGVSGLQTVTLTTTVNGCPSDAVSQNVQVNPIPVASFSKISPVCQGQATILTFTGRASLGANAHWTIDGGTLVGSPRPLDPQTIIWATPGAKVVTLQVDDRNCLSNIFEDTVVVNQIPTSTFSNPGPACVNDPVLFVYQGNAASSATYTWNFDGGVSVPAAQGQGPYTVTWATPGTKRICLNVQEKGCFSTQNCLNVQVYDIPTPQIDPVAPVCFDRGNNSVDFNLTGSAIYATYNWDFGAGAVPRTSHLPNPTGIKYNTIGTKTVTLSVANNGCISDPTTITFDVIEEPKADFILNTSGTICTHDNITFSLPNLPVGASQTYQWSFGQDANPATSSLPNPGMVTYTSSGVKTISLLVSYRGCTDVAAQQIRVEPSPIFDAGPAQEFCEGTGGVQLDAAVQGGTAGYAYAWSCNSASCGLSNRTIEDPWVNPIATPPATIIYRGQVVDAKGCHSNIDSVAVLIHPKPKVDAGPDMTMCEGGLGVTLKGGLHPLFNQAKGPFSWQWMDDQGNVRPAGMVPPNDRRPDAFTRPEQTIIYTLTSTDLSTGCTSQTTTVDPFSTVTVEVIPKPIAHAGADTVVCFGDQIQLNGFGTGGNGTYNYHWSPTNTGTINSPTDPDPTIGPNQSTIYTLVVTSEGCYSDGDQVIVVVHTIPTVEVGDDEDVCLGDSVQLSGQVSGIPQGMPGYTYEWVPSLGLDDPTAFDPKASPANTTTYQLVATSEYGCGAGADDVTVTINPTPIAAMLTPDTIICQGDAIKLAATHRFVPSSSPRVVYEWSPQGLVVDDIYSPTPTVKPDETTLFTVHVSSDDCATEAEVLVTVVPGITASISATDSTICAGQTTVLTASNGLGNPTYTWTPVLHISNDSLQEVIASPDVTTTYTLVMEEGICRDDTTITITVHPTPTSTYFASVADGCRGLEVSFMENTQDALSYIWDFGDGSPVNNEPNPSHVFNDPGAYSVSLTTVGTYGCESTTASTTVNISEGSLADFASTPAADIEIPLPNAVVQFEDLSANAVSWHWDFGDGNASSIENPAHTYRTPGEYEVTLTVTDANGCTSEITYGTYHVVVPGLLIPNVFSPNADGINDRFEVVYTGKEDFSLQVFDRWGKSVFETLSAGDMWDGAGPSGDGAHEGVYFYTLKIGDQSYTGNLTLVR